METNLSKIIDELFGKINMGSELVNYLKAITLIVLVIALAWLADFLVKRVLVSIVSKTVQKTKNQWDDVLLKRRIFQRIAHWAPALIIYYSAHLIFSEISPQLVPFIQAIVKIYMLIILMLVVDGVLESAHDIYNKLPMASNRPIKGYIQLVKILFYFVGALFIVSIILNKDISKLIAGLGAMAAVLMLIFKDTILGLVASVQLSANNMVKPGDWVVLPKFGADGTVLEITLNTVKIQNWDKTITTVPTYAMVSESFSNWKGMEESGGRRIKRHINIDMNSVKYCSEELIEKFKQIKVLESYIKRKEEEIKQFNEEKGIDSKVLVNGRRMTNLGVFRAYVENYLKNHPHIHQEMTFLVRHLQPTEKGIPLEIYVFSKIQAWGDYEAIQADIFDHIIAAIPEFDLRVFQNPSGADFKKLL